MSGGGDDRRGGAGSSSRAARPPNRVTLQFGGPPLRLPEDDPDDALDEDRALAPHEGEGARRRADDTLRDPAGAVSDAVLEGGARRRPSSDLRLDVVRAAASHEDFVLRDSLADSPLHLDTSELELDSPPRPLEPHDTDELRLELDELDDGPREAEDGWGRLRSGDRAPSRPRSVTPPAISRDDALDLVSRRSRPPSTPGIDLASEMADRYALGDYTGALRVAELVLGRNPDDPRAKRLAESSRERLLALYSARLASLAGISLASTGAIELGTRIPKVRVPDHEIRWLGLDHRQGFLLSRLDGSANIDDLVDVSGMSRLEVLKTLAELVEVGAVELV